MCFNLYLNRYEPKKKYKSESKWISFERKKKSKEKNDLEKWANRSYEARINQENIFVLRTYEIVWLCCYCCCCCCFSIQAANICRCNQSCAHLKFQTKKKCSDYFLEGMFQHDLNSLSPNTSDVQRKKKNNKRKAMDWKTTQSNMSGLFQQIDFLFFSILFIRRIKIDRRIFVGLFRSWSINKLVARKKELKMVTTNYFLNKPHKMVLTNTKAKYHHLHDWFFQVQAIIIKKNQYETYAPLYSLSQFLLYMQSLFMLKLLNWKNIGRWKKLFVIQ